MSILLSIQHVVQRYIFPGFPFLWQQAEINEPIHRCGHIPFFTIPDHRAALLVELRRATVHDIALDVTTNILDWPAFRISITSAPTHT